MPSHILKFLTTLLVGVCLQAQPPDPKDRTAHVEPHTREGDLRREMSRALDAFLAAYPDLEKRLDRLPPEEARRQIQAQRALARAYMDKKLSVYDYSIQRASAERTIFASARTEDPASLARQKDAAIARRADLTEQVQRANQLVQSLESRMAEATGPQKDRLAIDLNEAKEQAKTLAKLQDYDTEEITDIQEIQDRYKLNEKNRAELLAGKDKEILLLQSLKRRSEEQRDLYDRYFDALDQGKQDKSPGKPKK